MHWLTDGVFHKADTRDDYSNGKPLIYQDSGVSFDIPKNATIVEVPKGTVRIGKYAFHGFSRLKKVVLPEGIESIESFAFEGCRGLSEINFPASLKWLGIYAFSNTGFTSMEIPETIKGISAECFSRCSKLESFAFPPVEVLVQPFVSEPGKLCVDRDILSQCGMLKKIINYEYCSSALQLAECKSLEKAEIPINTEIIPHSAFKCTSITEIVIPEKVREIGNSAFDGCAFLTEIVIPEKVGKIDYDAFRNCTSLRKLVIPKSLQKIQSGAFRGCSALEHIVLRKGFHGFETAFPDSQNVSRVDITHSSAGKAHAVFPNADIYDLEGELCYSSGQQASDAVEDMNESPVVTGMAFEEYNVPKLKNAKWNVQAGNVQVEVEFKGSVTLNRSIGQFYSEKIHDDDLYYDAAELIQLNYNLYLTDEGTGLPVEALKADESEFFDFRKKYSQPLTHEELKQRAADFAKKTAQCFTTGTILRILDYLPKKKNGTLYRDKRTTILKGTIATSGGDVLVLYAENTGDRSVTFKVEKVYVGKKLYLNTAAGDILKL